VAIVEKSFEFHHLVLCGNQWRSLHGIARGRPSPSQRCKRRPVQRCFPLLRAVYFVERTLVRIPGYRVRPCILQELPRPSGSLPVFDPKLRQYAAHITGSLIPGTLTPIYRSPLQICNMHGPRRRSAACFDLILLTRRDPAAGVKSYTSWCIFSLILSGSRI